MWRIFRFGAEGLDVHNYPESFGERLRRLRETAGFSQETLAERAGLSTNAISTLERGERKRPYPDTIRRIADALGLSSGQREELAASARPDPPAVPSSATGTSSAIRGSLPAEPDALIGREAEVDVARRLLLLGVPAVPGRHRRQRRGEATDRRGRLLRLSVGAPRPAGRLASRSKL